MKQFHRASAAGASLVELMVALLLVATASTVLVKARVQSGERTWQAHQQSRAIAVAQEVVTRWRAEVPTELAVAGPDASWETISGCDKPCEFSGSEGLPVLAWAEQALPGGGLCFRQEAGILRVTVFWLGNEKPDCQASQRVEMLAPASALL